jgi:hypothetical protein
VLAHLLHHFVLAGPAGALDALVVLFVGSRGLLLMPTDNAA